MPVSSALMWKYVLGRRQIESTPSIHLMKERATMPFTPDLVEELNALTRYDLGSPHQGIKVHKTADAAVIAATARLFGKGLISQVDGGYLTSLGRNAAEHAHATLSLLTLGTALASNSPTQDQAAAPL